MPLIRRCFWHCWLRRHYADSYFSAIDYQLRCHLCFAFRRRRFLLCHCCRCWLLIFFHPLISRSPRYLSPMIYFLLFFFPFFDFRHGCHNATLIFHFSLPLFFFSTPCLRWLFRCAMLARIYFAIHWLHDSFRWCFASLWLIIAMLIDHYAMLFSLSLFVMIFSPFSLLLFIYAAELIFDISISLLFAYFHTLLLRYFAFSSPLHYCFITRHCHYAIIALRWYYYFTPILRLLMLIMIRHIYSIDLYLRCRHADYYCCWFADTPMLAYAYAMLYAFIAPLYFAISRPYFRCTPLLTPFAPRHYAATTIFLWAIFAIYAATPFSIICFAPPLSLRFSLLLFSLAAAMPLFAFTFIAFMLRRFAIFTLLRFWFFMRATIYFYLLSITPLICFDSLAFSAIPIFCFTHPSFATTTQPRYAALFIFRRRRWLRRAGMPTIEFWWFSLFCFALAALPFRLIAAISMPLPPLPRHAYAFTLLPCHYDADYALSDAIADTLMPFIFACCYVDTLPFRCRFRFYFIFCCHYYAIIFIIFFLLSPFRLRFIDGDWLLRTCLRLRLVFALRHYAYYADFLHSFSDFLRHAWCQMFFHWAIAIIYFHWLLFTFIAIYIMPFISLFITDYASLRLRHLYLRWCCHYISLPLTPPASLLRRHYFFARCRLAYCRRRFFTPPFSFFCFHWGSRTPFSCIRAFFV